MISLASSLFLQNNCVSISTERRFDGGDKFVLDVQMGNKSAGEGRAKSLRLIETAQNGLRTLSQAFAFFI